MSEGMLAAGTRASVSIRTFAEADASQVRNLFIRVNQLLAPPHMTAVFEDYIVNSLTREIDRIADYYTERDGGFWVAVQGAGIVGMFGLESLLTDGMELRRMYVDPDARRRGIARMMLQFAEDECRRRNKPRMDLSTSELQSDALAFYQNCGFEFVREDTAIAVSNKALGGGIRRFYFTKEL